MKIKKIDEILKNNPYPGRGIIFGRNPGGNKAVIAYFIMGRSENSRNRVFVESGNNGENVRSMAFDESKVTDPSLIIYTPVRVMGNRVFVTNGSQTDTIAQAMDVQSTFERALKLIEFEPDAPYYTPRISGVLHFLEFESRKFNYALSIAKTANGDPASCQRFHYSYYEPLAGEGHFIHTYANDSEKLPSFSGEPPTIEIPGSIDEFTDMLWNSMDNNNKISLFTRYVDAATGEYESRIINKNKKG